MSTKSCTEIRAIFFIVNGEKNYFLYYCNKFSHKRTHSILNNICGWIKMKERLLLNNTASMLTQRWVLKVCLTVVDIEFKNEIHSSFNLSLPNMYCFLIENTSCCFLLSHYFSLSSYILEVSFNSFRSYASFLYLSVSSCCIRYWVWVFISFNKCLDNYSYIIYID